MYVCTHTHTHIYSCVCVCVFTYIHIYFAYTISIHHTILHAHAHVHAYTHTIHPRTSAHIYTEKYQYWPLSWARPSAKGFAEMLVSSAETNLERMFCLSLSLFPSLSHYAHTMELRSACIGSTHCNSHCNKHCNTHCRTHCNTHCNAHCNTSNTIQTIELRTTSIGACSCVHCSST